MDREGDEGVRGSMEGKMIKKRRVLFSQQARECRETSMYEHTHGGVIWDKIGIVFGIGVVRES